MKITHVKQLAVLGQKNNFEGINFPRCSSLYSEFHYKVDKNSLEKLVKNSNKLKLKHNQNLRKCDLVQIDKLKKQLRSTNNQLEQTKVLLLSLKSQLRVFYLTKLQKIKQNMNHIQKNLPDSEKQVYQRYRIILSEKVNNLLAIFEISFDNDGLISFLIDEEVKKYVSTEKLYEIKIMSLEANNTVLQDKIKKLKDQIVKGNNLFSKEKEIRINKVSQLQKENEELNEKLTDQKQLVLQQNNEIQDLQMKKWGLKDQLHQLKLEQNIKKELAKRQLDSLNRFVQEFNIKTKVGSLEQFLKDESDTNEGLTNKSLTAVYKQKISYILHLFDKFERKHLQNYEKLKSQITSLNREIQLKNLQIFKQIQQINEYREKHINKEFGQADFLTKQKVSQEKMGRPQKKKYSLIL